MVRTLKGSIESLTEYIRHHPDITYSLEPCDDGEFILTFNVKLTRKRLPPPSRTHLLTIFYRKGGSFNG